MPSLRTSSRPSIRWVLAAAVAGPAVGLLTAPAHAQYQVNQNGGARDANNRIGSSGQNTGGVGRPGGYGVTANQIVNGNVTGGKEFRGPTASGDARAFRGGTAGNVSDAFIRNSSGGYDYQSPGTANQARPFYGESRAVQAPVGYVPTVNVYSSGQTAELSRSPTLNQPFLNAGNLGTLNTGEGLVPRLGTTTTIIGGAPDQANSTTGAYLVLTPLSGIRALTPDQLGSYTIRGSQIVPNGTTADRFRTTDVELLDKMRDELSNGLSGVKGSQPGNAGYSPNGQPAGAQPQQTAPNALGNPLGPPPESPVNKPFDAQQLNNSVGGAAQPLSSGIATGQSIRRQLIVPAQQSVQYNELERRFRESQGTGQPRTDQEAAQDLRNLKPLAPYAQPGMPGTPGVPGGAPAAPRVPAEPGALQGPVGMPPASPATPALPGGSGVPSGGGAAPGGAAPAPTVPGALVTPAPGAAPAAAAVAPAGRAEPLVISTLATGVSSPTLAQVLRQAEEELKQGRFTSASERYAVAAQAAPNNPLIAVGQANAELGGAAYRTAEQHLRQAFSADPALLLARYDLRSFLGQEKLDALVKDLTDLAKKDPADPMPPFLLAYIHHGIGEDAQAAARLGEVVQRQGGESDNVTALMRKHWGMAGKDLNK